MTTRSPWLILAIVSTALFLIVVDMTVLYTALPTLTHDLDATAVEKLWIVNAYSLTVAGLLPASGALGDRYGHRRMFMIGLVIFGAASLMAGMASSAEMLIAARAVLAVGAAAMMPATLSIIRQSFDDPDQRSLAIGVWAAVASGGAALGPVLGGVILEHFHWGMVFLINLPVVLIALPLAMIYVPRARLDGGHPFDPLGSVQILVALLGLTLAIKEVAKPEPTWQGFVLPLLVGAAALTLFLRRQIRSAHPMIDLNLFRDRRFSAGVIGAISAAAALMGMELVITQRLQLVSELSPLQAGLFILPIPLASFIAGPVAGMALSRVDAGRLMTLALAATGLGAIIYTASFDGAVPLQLLAFAIMGAGIGATMTAASSAIMMNAPANRAGMAASVEEVSYELGGALGIALLGSLMSGVYTATYLAGGDAAPALAADSLDQARLVAESLPVAEARQVIGAGIAAFDRSVLVVMIASTTVLVAASLWIGRLSRRMVGLRA
ncbi:MFS transporter [Paracoccus caeni]|uniref:MFS transporter n=1 Tax=Paracoccus caeni TaxID=657651 RepID=A0A934SD74_9RHOB|nr:MFS transporter [Paracoccus caeni]MBK4215742.1 MFS transporter [Paracoccus caeni]